MYSYNSANMQCLKNIYNAICVSKMQIIRNYHIKGIYNNLFFIIISIYNLKKRIVLILCQYEINNVFINTNKSYIFIIFS